ncbi:hypothetical protein JCM8097_003286 [Rhodosporidiobolus ruineniae]
MRLALSVVAAALLSSSALAVPLDTPSDFASPARSARRLVQLSKRANESCSASSSVAAAASYGNGTEVRLRIANGGAGQSGLVSALAEAFIDWSLENGTATEPYKIDWITADTTYSLDHLSTGAADIAITYNAQAEYRALNLSYATKRIYGFRDHFYLFGPSNNTANISSTDDVLTIFNKIVTTGTAGNGTRFLSRYDKSATNIKESLLFATIGQIPWAYTYSTWYHQYPVFPIEALTASAQLGEYTLSDRGTLLTLTSQSPDVAAKLVTYKAGADEDPNDLLLNPAAFLLGANVCDENKALAEAFMDWMQLDEGGQAVVANYSQPGSTDLLYTRAPNCTTEPDHCLGW